MRVWLYEQLNTLTVPGGVHENTALDDVPDAKPFIVYSMGAEASEIRDANNTLALSQYATIWAHGIPGDYQPLDTLLKEVRVLLESASDDTVMSVMMISTSDDLRDPEMGTIARYIRVQLVQATET